MNLRKLLSILGLTREQDIFYIGGSDILPPPLKGAQEQEALEALERGDENAKQTLVEHNLRLVVYIARRFENTGINIEDLISIGTIDYNQGIELQINIDTYNELYQNVKSLEDWMEVEVIIKEIEADMVSIKIGLPIS